ncbi:TIGR03667 family PPOX class F420-dependent oxidoreductase [Amycolatopsis thermophila]|uniref:PPOX class probable F420-dependent enzyme n=1 Tax=Amycolatopsis thermophila TaxID=206084 RepID=A0ABU0EVW1_9PSEU|nr:TIGR03667 family PPOX class F420-dependent oxidoreductase [Amycolatopsis thermophila]MDQ0379393.1 PPOX class probable F420-dependent enzyme [Amycolatopsis thermophila]
MAGDVLPDPSSPFGRRVRERLEAERVIWLTTTGADGTPQPNPVWFLWADGGFLIYNAAKAKRLDHIRDRPQVSLNFDSDGQGGNIVVFRGLARPADTQPAPHENEAYVEKYGEAMRQIRGSHEAFSEAYPHALRIEVNGVRGF